jgi:hypothetical protein
MRHALLALVLAGCTAAPVTPAAPASTLRTGFEIEPVGGLGLFSDERARSQQVLSQLLTSRDAGVIPLEVTERAWALAAEGRNPLTGAACGRSLPNWSARKRWGPQLGVTGTVRSQVWCESDGGCVLSVSGSPLDADDEEERFRLVAPIARTGEALSVLSSAALQLAPPPERGGGGLGMIGGTRGNQAIQDQDLLIMRLWPADHRDRTRVDDSAAGFPSLTVGQVLTCLSANDSSVQVLAEVDAAGVLARCEGEFSESPEEASCLCGQLRRSASADWLKGKRWSVSARVDRRDQLTSDRRLVLSGSWNTYLHRVNVPGQKYPRFAPKVEDPSIEAWSVGPTRLALGCFVNAFPQAGALSTRWAVWFDGAGRPIKTAEQKGFPALPKDVAECVSNALRTAQSPCPSRPGLWAMADLRVSARDPNAPQPSLNEVLKPKP